MPTNPSGPQKAVTVPVIRQQESIDRTRIRLVDAPESVAYSSPNRMMSSPLPLTKASIRPMRSAPAISATSTYRHPEKLPAIQL